MPPPAEIPPLREAFGQFLRLVRLIRPYWGLLARSMMLGLVIGLAGMAVPYLSKLLIDEVYPARDVTLMHVLVGGLLTLSVASAAMGAIRGYFQMHVNSRLTNATTLMFFNHLQHLRARFFEEHRVGEVMSRFGDVRSSLGTVSNVFGTVFIQSVYLLLVPPILFLLQWKLALVALAATPLTIAITVLTARIVRRYYKRTAEAYAELSAYQVEVLSHIRTLKVLAVEHQIFARARDQVGTALNHQLRAGAIGQGFGTLNTVIGAFGTALFTWYGWTLILRQDMTLGSYIAFMAYVGYFTRPLMQLTNLFAGFQQSAVNLGRMFEYLDEATEQDPASAYAPPAPIRRRLTGRVELRGVSFGYSEEKRVLHDVDLVLHPGTVTAIVGASGVGKSSLLRLICRMEEPDAGAILLDGIPAAEIPLSELRRQVSVVWQEFSLMKGTIWDNLTLGVEAPRPVVVEDAMRLCRLEDLVAELPQGYQTPVAEWGASLSGGQRQRMALARALIRETPVLLLDEATSNIDQETEAEILRDLFTRRADRTILFVTHRVSTATAADQICVLHGGRVAGAGTHAELLEGCEPYRRMQSPVSSDDSRRLRIVQPLA